MGSGVARHNEPGAAAKGVIPQFLVRPGGVIAQVHRFVKFPEIL
jgi:hypothetical protein